MTQRIKSDSDFYVQNEGDLLGNGKDGSSSANAGGLAYLAKNLVWDGSAFQLLKQAVTGSITSLVGITNVINLARYNATLPTLTDGDHRGLQHTSRAELLVALSILGTQATIKPASTLPASTDTAIVVTQRDSLPNTAPTKRSGVSSGTANTFTQFIAANTARKSFFIHNPPTSGDILDLAVGVSVDVSATTNATSTLTSSAAFGSVAVGDWVTGTGIPAGTYVQAIASSSSLTLSAAATNSATNTISFWSAYLSLAPGDSVAVNTKADDLPTAAIYGRYQTNTNVRYTAWES